MPIKKAMLNGVDYPTTVMLKFEDDKTNTGSSIILDSQGVCELVYKTEINNAV